MTSTVLADRASAYLRRLCEEYPGRNPGSAANRGATDFFARTVGSFGFAIECPTFECLDWVQEGARLSAGGVAFEVFPSPYSLGCRVHAPLAVVSTAEELEASELAKRVALLRGEIAKQQLMPKNFPFYNPDEHRRIIALLEAKAPLAIVAATGRDEQMVGAQYPFPLFEDGDFDIPSVYMTDVQGDELAKHAGEMVVLESQARRIPAVACNVIARKGAQRERRVVVVAHIDARQGTPGAGDNASGVTVLLLLAELLAGYAGELGIELVAMNGEDYYSNPGEQLYLRMNAGRLEQILLVVNVDDVGHRGTRTAYSLYECPAEITAAVEEAFAGHAALVAGEPWYQGDHMVFVQSGRPALALTSDASLGQILREITHTAKDRPELIEPDALVAVAAALRELLLGLGARTAAKSA